MFPRQDTLWMCSFVVREERNVKTTLLDQSGNFEKRSARSKEALGNCTLNKNPADFSIPQVGNIFTLTGKELEPRRRNAFKEKSPAENIDGRKRKNACSTSWFKILISLWIYFFLLFMCMMLCVVWLILQYGLIFVIAVVYIIALANSI